MIVNGDAVDPCHPERSAAMVLPSAKAPKREVKDPEDICPPMLLQVVLTMYSR